MEIYARDVSLEIKKQNNEGIIVKESPIKRDFFKLLKRFNASWIFDLHSEVTEPYWIMKNRNWIRALPFPYSKETIVPRIYEIEPTDYSCITQEPYPIARIIYGGKIRNINSELSMPTRNWVGEILQQFSLEKYGLKNAITISASYPIRRIERLITFGLIYQRPLDISVDLVKSLAEYLYERF